MRLSILSLTFFAIPVAFAQQLRLDSSCDAKVNGWVDEALFLLDRASKVLKEATKRDTSMQPNYKEVLDAFLGADAGVDVYKAVQARMEKVASTARTSDILIRCGEARHQRTGQFDLKNSDIEQEQWVLPVAIDRVYPTITNDERKRLKFRQSKWTWWFPDSNTVNILSQAPTPDNAYTLAGNRAGIKQTLDSLLGPRGGINTIRTDWSDIVLTNVYTANLPNKLYPDFNSDWRVENWGTTTSLMVQTGNPTPATTIIHELMHSHLAFDPPNETHARLSVNDQTIDANYLYWLLQLGNAPRAQAGSTNLPENNPDTYAWLAICLSMPWYKFWDRSTDPPTFDGFMRWNLHDITYKDQVFHNAYSTPKFLQGEPANPDPNSDEGTRERGKGPYANWNQ